MPIRCDVVLADALVLTMDDRFTIHESGSVAIDGDGIVAVGPAAAAYEAAERIRLRRTRRDAGPGQRAYARADDAAARAGRRSAARRLADGLHDAGRARVREPGLRPARHRARLRRDDPLRRDLLRRHVLLRRGGRRGDGRRRHARAVRADGAALPDARRDQLRGLAGPRARFHRAAGAAIR